MGVGMWMTWGRPGCGENGSLGGVEQVGTGESWIGGGTWRVLNLILFLTFFHLVFVASGLVVLVQVALEGKGLVAALAFVVLE